MMHEEYAHFPICQSCGMPMQEENLFGKNADGTENREYCRYCCPFGEENMLGTQEDMIACCTKIETQMGHFPDEQTAREKLADYLPTLRRWKK